MSSNEFLENLKYKSVENIETTLSPSAKFFKENGYIKVENFIDKNMAYFLYNYVIIESKRLSFLNELHPDLIMKPNKFYGCWGVFDDPQALGDFSRYGCGIFDNLLNLKTEEMSSLTGINLIPQYSYHRLYTSNSELARHKDRPSCEISCTLFLGSNTSNIREEYSWPMYIKRGGEPEIPINLNPGDIIVYRGCELEHWREPFKGLNHAQVFLHYNEKDGEYNKIYDDRPALGITKSIYRD